MSGYKIKFDTSGLTTSSGRCIVQIKLPGDETKYSFEMAAGMSSGKFIAAAVEPTILHDQIDDNGIESIRLRATDSMLTSFYALLTFFQRMMGLTSLGAVIISRVLNAGTRGLACGFNPGNTVLFVFFLVTEVLKFIMAPESMRLQLRTAHNLFSKYTSVMANAQANVPNELAEQMAHQLLAQASPNFPLSIALAHRADAAMLWTPFCLVIPIYMPGMIPIIYGDSLASAPINDKMVGDLTTENHVVTDLIFSMMQKQAYLNTYVTRFDWKMKPWGYRATYSSFGGAYVVVKTGGVHQEIYSVDDKAFQLHGGKEADNDILLPTNTGPIGETWSDIKIAVSAQGSLPRFGAPDGLKGEDAVDFMEKGEECFVAFANKVVIMDITDNKVKVNSFGSDDTNGEYIEVALVRPNPNVVIAIELEGK